jgi:hypothetical protein
MTKKQMPQRVRLCALFVSFTILIMGGVSLFENMTIDYYSVLGTLTKIIPASIAMGGLGWVMGMILDKPKKASTIKYNNMFLKNVVKGELPENIGPEDLDTKHDDSEK